MNAISGGKEEVARPWAIEPGMGIKTVRDAYFCVGHAKVLAGFNTHQVKDQVLDYGGEYQQNGGD